MLLDGQEKIKNRFSLVGSERPKKKGNRQQERSRNINSPSKGDFIKCWRKKIKRDKNYSSPFYFLCPERKRSGPPSSPLTPSEISPLFFRYLTPATSLCWPRRRGQENHLSSLIVSFYVYFRSLGDVKK